MQPLRMLSLCSGIGAIDCVWSHILGQIVAGQVEIDPYCRAVLAKQWPDVLRLADIKQVKGDGFGAIDILVGGVPCQSFSKAGKRGGTADDRHLWPYAFAIVQVARPRWVVIENVDNFINMAFELVATDEGRAKATKSGRLYFQLVPSVRRIEDNDASLWRTLTSHDGKSSREQRGYTMDLSHQMQTLWPTPTASLPNDGEKMESWQTRRERVKESRKNGNGFGTSLSMAVQMWHTPSTHDARTHGVSVLIRYPDGKHPDGSKVQVGLDDQVRALSTFWPTPKVTQRGGGASEMRRHSPDLQAVAKMEPTTSQGKLNPEWVECLMGLPVGWTDIDGPLSQKRSKKRGNHRARSRTKSPIEQDD